MFASSAQVFSELMNVSAEQNRYVVYRQMTSFRIEAESPIHMNLDGEPMLDTTYEFQVLPRALQFVLPDTAPLSVKSACRHPRRMRECPDVSRRFRSPCGFGWMKTPTSTWRAFAAEQSGPQQSTRKNPARRT